MPGELVGVSFNLLGSQYAVLLLSSDPYGGGSSTMIKLVAQVSTWLQSVLRGVPSEIRAIYVEFDTSAYTRDMVHEVCFNAFGYQTLAGGKFDPKKKSHVGKLGEFTWEEPDDCRFRADEFPDADWLKVLSLAAKSPEVMSLAAELGIQFVIGEHDGEVLVIR